MLIGQGTLIAGRYVVERKLGEGNWGEVWLAHHAHVGMRVAIKSLLEAKAASHDAIVRFEREAKFLGRIQSDYVARVLDFLNDDIHGLVLVMELVEGYMSPEQVLDSRKVTVASDVYALGAMLYRCVSGEYVFTDEGDPIVARKKLSLEAPRLDSRRTDEIAKGFEDVVAKALRRRPEDRYVDARAMLADLLALKNRPARVSAPLAPAPPPPPQVSNTMLAIAGVSLHAHAHANSALTPLRATTRPCRTECPSPES